jgi:hypothetical protein
MDQLKLRHYIIYLVYTGMMTRKNGTPFVIKLSSCCISINLLLYKENIVSIIESRSTALNFVFFTVRVWHQCPLYKGVKTRVKTDDGFTEFFRVHAGVLQGDTLAPFLFILVVDYIMRKAMAGLKGVTLINKTKGKQFSITDMDYADDICIMSDDLEQLQACLLRVQEEALSVGLRINFLPGKTELLVLDYTGKPPTDNILYNNTGGEVAHTKEYKYLGAQVVDQDKELKRRIGLAWGVLKKLECMWKSPLTRTGRIILFNSLVLEIFLYGCTTWTLRVSDMRLLTGSYTRMVRYVLQKKVYNYNTRISNDILLEGFHDLEREIVRRRLVFAGECARAPKQYISVILLAESTKTGAGHHTTYTSMLMKCTGLSLKELDVYLMNPEPEAMVDLLDRAMHIITEKRTKLANKVRIHIKDLVPGRRKPVADLKAGSLEGRHRFDDKRINQLVCCHKTCSQKVCACCQQCETRHHLANLIRCLCCGRGTGKMCMKKGLEEERPHYEYYLKTLKFVCVDCYKLKSAEGASLPS